MTPHACCVGSVATGGAAKRAWTLPPGPRVLLLPSKRALGVGKWALPGCILVLLPKCPACIVAYVAIASGAGISFSAASYLRASLLLIGFASLAYLLIRSGFQRIALRRSYRTR